MTNWEYSSNGMSGIDSTTDIRISVIACPQTLAPNASMPMSKSVGIIHSASSRARKIELQVFSKIPKRVLSTVYAAAFL